MNESTSQENRHTGPTMTNPHHARLMASNAKLLQTGKYSDLTVRCGAREWQLHRSIVCEGSKFFAVACDGPFLVGEALATLALHELTSS